MRTDNRLILGAPGLYTLPEEPVRALTGARMDVCAFAGVSPRGPSRPPRFETPWAQKPCQEGAEFPRSVAVAVESFDAYRRLYGGFEGPGRLPYAVASFFEQGGLRAYVVRVVHHYTTSAGGIDVSDPVENAKRVANATLGAVPLQTTSGHDVRLRARDEGAWGNRLSARLSFQLRPLEFTPETSTAIAVAPDEALPDGSLIRFRLADGSFSLGYVAFQRTEWHPNRPELRRLVVLDAPLDAVPEAAEVADGVLDVDDHDGRKERHGALGLAPEHPRFIARVLYEESSLLHPTAAWLDAPLALSDVRLAPLSTQAFDGGADGYADIVPEDFFDELGWTPGDDCPGAGVHALVGVPDLGSLVAVDLYSPGPLAAIEPIAPVATLAGPEFADCVPIPRPAEQALPPNELGGLRLDPEDPADRERITTLQLRLVELAEILREFVVLLDVPPRLNQRQLLRWRQRFGSAYAAAYHPWLKIVRADDSRDALIDLNPAAVAAGIIARKEIEAGIPHGPANVIAEGVVDVEERLSAERHGELHQSGVNAFLRTRDGVQLTAARTLSRDARYRQLSVRRLMTMLRRTLESEMQWAVFEPNNASLRADVKRLLAAYLRRLYRANAFRGATEGESFFVKCDEELNPSASLDQGRLVAHVGVAPTEPLEFLVLKVARGGDGTLTVEG
jgi:hypothetical protein